MIRVDQFEPGDLAALIPQAEQSGAADVSWAMGERLALAGPAFTIRDAGDRLLLTAGFLILGDHHARCWCRLAQIDGFQLAAVTRRVRAVIGEMARAHRRIDMEVRTGFAAGATWARMLGFTREGTMRAYGAAGEDFDLYARIGGIEHG